MNRTSMRTAQWCALLIWMALTVAPMQAQSPYRAISQSGPKPIYLRDPSRSMRLPLAELPEKERAALREIKLFVKAPGSDWTCALTGPPTQTMFDYRAEKDGEYAFMFVKVDRKGLLNPSSFQGRAPHQVVVIDTQPPLLGVVLAPISKSDLYLKVEMNDANPDWSSVKLDYLEGTQWKSFAAFGPNSPGIFRIHDRNLLNCKIRITATDLAGNLGTRFIDFNEQTQALNVPQPKPEPANLPMGIVTDPPPVRLNGNTTQTNFSPELKIPGEAILKNDLPPLADPVKLPDVKQPGTDTSLKIPDPMDTPNPVPSPPKSVANVRVDPFLPSVVNDLDLPATPTGRRKPESVAPAAPAREIPAPTGGKHAIVNAPRCSLEYAVETTPFAGPPRLEFWATRDNGQSWQKLVDETPGHSPAKLLLPGEGYFGIKAKTSRNNQPPSNGDSPDAYVEVDITKPVVNLLPVTLGTGPELGTITLQWAAQDKNLVHNSISLFYKTKSDSQWKPIVAHTKNEGSFRWTVPQDIGTEVYVMMEARDRAGNVGRCELSEPVLLPQPKVTVLGVGPAQ